MTNELYHEACDYAYKMSPALFTDIVHDAYISYYDKTQKNLFEEDRGTVLKTVKKTFWKKYFHKNIGKTFRDKMKQNRMTPEDEFISREYGLEFVSYYEIEEQVEGYEQEHVRYPKLNLN
jgi:hypothetical protein